MQRIAKGKPQKAAPEEPASLLRRNGELRPNESALPVPANQAGR
jgi:hypothetical protein